MAKTKRFAIRSGGVTYTLREATLYLNDFSQFGSHNTPSIGLRFDPPSDPDCTWDRSVTVEISFQRNRAGRIDSGDRATGYMDTVEGWSCSYGGHVSIGDAGRFDLRDQPFSLDYKDKLRVAVARKLAKVCHEFNLYHVNPDQCVQTVNAIAKLGGHVDKKYPAGANSEYVLLSDAKRSGVKLRCNEREEDSAREAA